MLCINKRLYRPDRPDRRSRSSGRNRCNGSNRSDRPDRPDRPCCRTCPVGSVDVCSSTDRRRNDCTEWGSAAFDKPSQQR